MTHCNGLGRAEIGHKLAGVSIIVKIGRGAGDAYFVLEQSYRAVDAGVRSGDAGDGQCKVLNAAHVMARIVHGKECFRQINDALAGFFEGDQRHGIKQDQGDVFADLIFPRVLVKVGELHPAEIVVQPFACEQAFL